MANLRNNLIFAQPGIINRDYEGEITEPGSSVRILSIGRVNIGDYTKNTDFSAGPQILDDASQSFQVNRARYFNFYVDDVDGAQRRPQIMNASMSESAFALANDIDGYVAGKYGEAGVTIGTDASPKLVGLGTTDSNGYELLVDISTALDEQNCPPDGRYCAVPPWFYGLLLKDQRFTSFGTPQNRATIQNGIIGTAAGLTILRSNQVATKVTGQYTNYKILAGHERAITYADQINKTEAYRPQLRFGDAVKGLALYDCKVVRPSLLLCMTARQA